VFLIGIARAERISDGIRHIEANFPLYVEIFPSRSTTRSPSAVDSRVARRSEMSAESGRRASEPDGDGSGALSGRDGALKSAPARANPGSPEPGARASPA